MKLDTYFSKFIDDLKLNAQKPAIIENNISYSYEKLHEKISFYIEELESKNIQNKVIYLLSDYSFNAISLFFALTHCRNIIVPVVSENVNEQNQRMEILSPDYILSFLNLSGEVSFIKRKRGNIERHSLIKSLFQNDTPGVVLFSSGTTGKPKAMIHDLNSLLKTFLDKRKRV